jgi:hypothetical protein
MPAGECLVENYLHWLFEEISGLPDMFRGVNEIFAIAVIERALVMVGDSGALNVMRGVTTGSGLDVLPVEPDVRTATRADSKKWWHLFGYAYVLSTIRGEPAKPGLLYPLVWIPCCDIVSEILGSRSRVGSIAGDLESWVMCCDR